MARRIGGYEYEWLDHGLSGFKAKDDLRKMVLDEIEEKHRKGWELVMGAEWSNKFLYRRVPLD